MRITYLTPDEQRKREQRALREVAVCGLPIPSLKGAGRDRRAEWYLLEDKYMRLVVDRTGTWFCLGWDEDEFEETVADVRPEDTEEMVAALRAAAIWHREMKRDG